ncbi:MAG TPA: serine/threonine-protein kinase [Kofleriaceae bacterium]|nr:serine/threonine-protein kinase [Kofleriaceae bacterium]
MAATTKLISGDRVGNYRLEHELSCDGQGVTYRAVHLVLPRRAVIKVMHAETSQFRAIHMLREACILEALHHPGVSRVYESGLLSDRRPWFAREHVEGLTLASAMIPGVLAQVNAVALLRDLAGVLEHAHHRGIVHCGLRPSRVLLSDRGRAYPVCITDWSTARAFDSERAPYVVTSESLHYTAPELAAGEDVDERTDVFALGVIAYEMLTGVVPYEHRLLATGAGRCTHVPTALRCPDAPDELTALIDQMLVYAGWERPSSTEVHERLASIVERMARPARTAAMRIRRPRWTPPVALQPLPVEAMYDRATTDRDEERG